MSVEYDDAINLLYDNLGALPDPEYTHLNLLPFTHDSEATNELKRRVSTSVVNLFADAGYAMKIDTTPVEATRRIRVMCRSCGGVLFTGVTDHDGGLAVAGPALLSTLSSLTVECPHKKFSATDQRLMIEESVLNSEGGQ